MPPVISPPPEEDDEVPHTGFVRHDGRVTPWHEHVFSMCAVITLSCYGTAMLVQLALSLFFLERLVGPPDLRWLVLTLSSGTLLGQLFYQTDVRINGGDPEASEEPSGEWRPLLMQPSVGVLVRYAYPGARNGRQGTVVSGPVKQRNTTLVRFQGEAHPTEVPLSKLEWQ